MIEIYEFLATRDHKTSKPYQELDWKRFYIKDVVPGKNYPPMNQNYQGTTVVAFEDDKVTKCLTKDKSGKYYKMPSDMAYSEWKKKDTGGMVTGGSRVEEPVIRKHKLDMDVEKELLAVRAAI